MNMENPYDLDRDVEEIKNTANNVYRRYFEKYFKRMRYWHKKYTDETTDNSELKMTDSELEAALSDLPLEMFGVSEELSNFRLKQGVIKLKLKELDLQSKQEGDDFDSSVLDYCKLEYSICGVIISRVEQEISFSREFIMVLKKIWDARRATDRANPIADKSYELPEYDPLKATKKPQGGIVDGELQGLNF